MNESLTLTLPFPPSVNTYYRRGKFATYLSPKGKKFKQQVAEIVCESGKRIEGRLSVFIALFQPTKRTYDIDNRVKATLDALQDAGLFDDDEQVDELQVIRQRQVKGGKCIVVVTNCE